MSDHEVSGEEITDRFRVLDIIDTDMGLLMVRKWWSETLEDHVFDLMMDNQVMMSSAVIESEVALAKTALSLLPEGNLRVLVGGLGFGFTAQAALADSRVQGVTVVEYLPAVIRWHRVGYFPWSSELVDDARLELVEDDFFTHIKQESEKRYDAILVDIDDSPDLLWHAEHAQFYPDQGIAALHRLLNANGVFALWCATQPGDWFLGRMREHFAVVNLVEVTFENPCWRQTEANFLVIAMGHGQERWKNVAESS